MIQYLFGWWCTWNCNWGQNGSGLILLQDWIRDPVYPFGVGYHSGRHFYTFSALETQVNITMNVSLISNNQLPRNMKYLNLNRNHTNQIRKGNVSYKHCKIAIRHSLALIFFIREEYRVDYFRVPTTTLKKEFSMDQRVKQNSKSYDQICKYTYPLKIEVLFFSEESRTTCKSCKEILSSNSHFVVTLMV